MLKRLSARGKQPPGPVSPIVTTNDNFSLPQSSTEGGPASPVSPNSVFTVTVYTLDDEQKPLEISVQKDSDGEWLFEEACELMGGIQEKDYFGLRFLDRDKQRQWVDPTRNIYRQLKHMHPCCVSFRVKHYPPNPLDDFKQEISKYFLYLQLKRDILHSRLLCQGNEAYELAAYIAQIDLGDHEDMEDPENYLAEFKILPNQSPKSETKIAEIHKTLKGLVPCEAEAKFLELASKMETYGIDPYSVKDQKGNVLYLGLTHVGVVTFQGSRRAHIFKWSDITKFNYDGKLFIIHVTFREDNQFKRKKKHILGFKCESRPAALSLWRWAVDRYCFFTLKRSSEAKRSKSGGGLFRRSHTFRFSGRCQREALSNSLSLLTLPQPDFKRSASFRREERVIAPTELDDKFATFPRTRRQNENGAALTAAASAESNLDHGGQENGDAGSSDAASDEAAPSPAPQTDLVDVDGAIVESIIIPDAACQSVLPPGVRHGSSERGVDVGDGPVIEFEGVVQEEAPPCQSAPHTLPNDAGAPPKKVLFNHVADDHKSAAVGSRGAGWCLSLLKVLVGVVVCTVVVVAFFEAVPHSPVARSVAGGRLLEDWRDQWYLPLRNKFFPVGALKQ